jgi:hypothetical protein
MMSFSSPKAETDSELRLVNGCMVVGSETPEKAPHAVVIEVLLIVTRLRQEAP